MAEAIRRRRRVGGACRRLGSSLWSLSSLRIHGEREYKTQRPFFATLILPPKSSVVRSKTRSRDADQTNKPTSQPNERRRPGPDDVLAVWQCTSDNGHITTHSCSHNLFPFFPSTPFVESTPPIPSAVHRHPHNEALFHFPSTFQYATCLFLLPPITVRGCTRLQSHSSHPNS